MNKKLAITWIVIGFVGGAVVAGGIVRHFYIQRLVILNKFLDYQFECQPEISTLFVSVSALQKLRSDETFNSNAVEYLELQLDYAVAGIGKYVEHHPMSERDPSFPSIKATLRSAKRYREQFPYTNQDALIQKEIEQAFSLVNDLPKH